MCRVEQASWQHCNSLGINRWKFSASGAWGSLAYGCRCDLSGLFRLGSLVTAGLALLMRVPVRVLRSTGESQRIF